MKYLVAVLLLVAAFIAFPTTAEAGGCGCVAVRSCVAPQAVFNSFGVYGHVAVTPFSVYGTAPVINSFAQPRVLVNVRRARVVTQVQRRGLFGRRIVTRTFIR